MSDAEDGSWGGGDGGDGAGSGAGQETVPGTDMSGGGGDPAVSEGIESAWCFTDRLDLTHTVYARSLEDAQKKAPGWDFCHQGACQYSSAIEEARLCG